MNLSLLEFIILSLASYRITHLIVFDKVFSPIRNYFVTLTFDQEMKGPVYILQGGSVRHFIGNIMKCHWCTGFWVALFAVILWSANYAKDVFTLNNALLVLAISAVSSLIETCWVKLLGIPHEIPVKKSK